MSTPLITVHDTESFGQYATQNRPLNLGDLKLYTVFFDTSKTGRLDVRVAGNIRGLDMIYTPRHYDAGYDFVRVFNTETIVKSGPKFTERKAKAAESAIGKALAHAENGAELNAIDMPQLVETELLSTAQNRLTGALTAFNDSLAGKVKHYATNAASLFPHDFEEERKAVDEAQEAFNKASATLGATRDALHKAALAKLAQVVRDEVPADVLPTDEVLRAQRERSFMGLA